MKQYFVFILNIGRRGTSKFTFVMLPTVFFVLASDEENKFQNNALKSCLSDWK